MREWLRSADNWIDRHRPLVLLGTAALTVIAVVLLDRITGAQLYERFFHPQACAPASKTPCDPIAWKDLFHAAVVLLGLPAAFWLWHWRDRNVRYQIENARKDINLKEFQEVQLRAAGALDEKLPAAAREQLQIAALHQLRGFLRGDYGPDFRRPAFELLLAGHASAIQRTGLWDKVEALLRQEDDKSLLEIDLDHVWRDASDALTAVDKVRMAIISDEWRAIFHSGFPLRGRVFDGIDLAGKQFPAELDLSGASFRMANLDEVVAPFVNLSSALLDRASANGANLALANLQGASLGATSFRGTKLDGAEIVALTRGTVFSAASMRAADLTNNDLRTICLDGADLTSAYLSNTNLTKASLNEAILDGANLYRANLSSANLRFASLKNAHLRQATVVGACLINNKLDGADLTDCGFDDSTEVIPLSGHNTVDDGHKLLRSLGARHVNDKPIMER